MTLFRADQAPTAPTASHGLALDARGLVPTARQAALGAQHVAPAPPPEDDRPDDGEAQAPLGERIRAYARGMDLRKVDGPKLPIVVFVALALLTSLDEQAIPLILPDVQVDFGVTTGPVLTLLQAMSIISILLQPLWGWLSDRVKRVHLIRVGTIGQNALAAAATTTGSFPGFAGTVAAGGAFAMVSQAPSSTIMADYYPRAELARILPYLTAIGQVPIIVAPPLVGLLIDTAGWRVALFLLAGIASVVSGLTFLLRVPRRGQSEEPVSDRGLAPIEADAAMDDASVDEPSVPFAEAWRTLRSINTVRRIWYATPFCFAGVLGIFIHSIFYFTSEFGLTASQRGLILSMQGAVLVAGSLLSSPLLARVMAQRPGRVMTIAGALMAVDGVAALLLWFSPSVTFSVVVALPVVLVQGMALPPYGVLFRLVLLAVVPPRIRGVGLTSTAPFVVLGVVLLYFVAPLLVIGPSAPRQMMLALVPMFAIGAYLLASASSGVDRDIRTAEAVAAAELAGRRAKDAGSAKLLVCRGVEVAYGGTQVLFGVDLDVDDGEILALLGTNGAGKSTILRAIAGIQEASAGAIFFDGVEITHEPAHANAARGVVMMPGGHAVFPTLTVAENLRAAAWLRRDEETYVAERTEEVLDFFPRLRERYEQVAGTLSGGEQQMVALGQAFLMKPRLLMIDELSLGLAPKVVEQLLDILRAIHASGTTVVLVEQSVNIALTIADRAVFMEKGQKLFDGPTEALLERPDLVRSVFMGGATSGKGLAGRRRRAQRTTETATAGLGVDDVAVSFGGVQALQGVSLAVAPGEIVGLIGPNGAGKTTLFDVISGYVTPNTGSIRLGGDDVTALGPDARAVLGLGRSFQNVRLFPSITVRENIAVAMEERATKNPVAAMLWSPKHREAEGRIRRRVDGLIELLGLKAFGDKFVGELSTGSRRAVEVACMLAFEPKILLLDEPTSGLAQAESEELGPVLERVVRETGCGLLVIEHDIPLVSGLSDRLIAMELGRVIATGPPPEVVTEPAVLASYLAASDDVVQRSGRVHAIAAALGRAVEHPGDDGAPGDSDDDRDEISP